ncbi:SMI1/KNR4 family protein [Amycolatopsis sp. VS8301801F10]|uniref:SMI1/KNR4 family protein n=1 Tax=unclassified Amycolatopsis TaxID=2618356 RepID=UPI0038FC5850
MVATGSSRLLDMIVEAVQWHGRVQPARTWQTVEDDIGTKLPDDYKELFSRFPSGSFRDVITVINPIDSRTNYDNFIEKETFEIIKMLDEYRNVYLSDVDYRLFPEKGGLLPWGGDGEGGMFFWLTDSEDPNQWRVARYGQSMDEWREHDGPMTQVIWEVLTSADDENIFGWSLEDLPKIFRVPSTYLGDGRWLPHAEYR